MLADEGQPHVHLKCNYVHTAATVNKTYAVDEWLIE